MVCHVAISGDIGSGKTSVALLLSQSAKSALVSAGGILRKMAAERGITALEANRIAERDDTIDTEINRMLVNLGRSETKADLRLTYRLASSTRSVQSTPGS